MIEELILLRILKNFVYFLNFRNFILEDIVNKIIIFLF